MSPLESLIERIKEIGKEIKRNSGFYRVITHVDADGIGSGALLFKTLTDLGREVHISFLRDFTRESLVKIFEEDFDVIIFSDLGSSHLEEISYWAERKGGMAIVLDHHTIPGEIPSGIYLANPWEFGMSGDREACASSLSLLLSTSIRESNWAYSSFAFAGMLGDRQLVFPVGLNELLLKEAMERGVLVERREEIVRGERVAEALAYSLPPYLKGLTGRLPECEKILKKYGIRPEASMIELDQRSLKTLNSIIVLRLLEQGLEYDEIEELFYPRYWASDPFPAYVDEIAGYLSSIGNIGEFDLAIRMIFGEESAIKRAREISERIRREIIRGLMDLEKGIKSLRNIQYFFCPDPKLKSPIASYGAAYILEPSKALIVLSEDKGGYRVSARCRRRLIDKGANLAEIMRRVCEKFKGHGGGHKIAAGGFFVGDPMDFLKEVDKELGRQIGVGVEGKAKGGGKLPIRGNRKIG